MVSALEFARQAQIAANQAFLASIDRVFDSGDAAIPDPAAHLEQLRRHAKHVALEASAAAASKQRAEAHNTVAYRVAARKRRRAWLEKELVKLGEEEEEDVLTLREIDKTCLKLQAHLARLGGA